MVDQSSNMLMFLRWTFEQILAVFNLLAFENFDNKHISYFNTWESAPSLAVTENPSITELRGS